MIHPHTEVRFINEVIGYGVVATRPIPAGTITWALDPLDRRMSADEASWLPAESAALLDRYSFVNGAGERILCWDHAKLVNHSCEATCLSPGFAFEIAVRDIEPGEQLTDDYASLNLDEPFACHCESPRCRGTVHPHDFDVLAPMWDAQIQLVFSLIAAVDQPLWPFVTEPHDVSAGVVDPARIPSIAAHRFPSAPATRRRAQLR